MKKGQNYNLGNQKVTVGTIVSTNGTIRIEAINTQRKDCKII